MPAGDMTDVREGEKEAEKEEKELEQKWHNINGGNLDHDLLPEGEEEDQYPPGSMRHKVVHILTNWKFELFIVVLIIGDLVFTLIEVGIDYKKVCIGGELVPVGRQSIKGLSMQQYSMKPAFESPPSTEHDLGHNTSLSSPALFADMGTLQKEAVRGAVMLQVSNAVEGLAKVAHFTNKQREEVPAAQPEGSENAETGEEGHGEHEESTLVCEGPHGENRHHLSHTCHMGSVAILTVFLLELMAKAWVNFSQFVSSFFQLLDLAVVSISFFVDFVWPFIIGHIVTQASDHLLGESQSDAIKFLLLTVRLLRIVRVIHGAYGVLSKGLSYTKELKEKVKEKEEEIIKLKGELAAAKK